MGLVGSKLVHRASKKKPDASRGTPRMTLPAAAPKKIASSALETKKPASQKVAHMGCLRCDRSSIETPRIIRSHSTIIKGR
ncbi:hypothetical protein D3C86_1429510 [compost metagenome]